MINIRQIYFKEEQKEKLSPLFVPYDNSHSNEPEWVEYGVILKSYKDGFYKSSDYTGVFSWRFEDKTKISSETFIEFIEQNPGYDVYFINPFHIVGLQYDNVWKQGDNSHPGLMKLAQEIFNNIGYKIDLTKIITRQEDMLFSNYWVGNQKFWKKYIQFTEPVYEYVKNLPEGKFKKRIYRDAKYFYKVTNIPFLMERMFNTLLCIDSDIKYKACMLNYNEDDYFKIKYVGDILDKYLPFINKKSGLVFIVKIHSLLPEFVKNIFDIPGKNSNIQNE